MLTDHAGYYARPVRAPRPGPAWLPRFVLLIALATLIYAALGVLRIVPLLQPHALIGHPTDAPLVRKCIEKNGPYQMWERRGDALTRYQTCQLADGRWGLQAIKWDKVLGKWVEKTSFVRKDGTWQQLMDYLHGFAKQLKPVPVQ